MTLDDRDLIKDVGSILDLEVRSPRKRFLVFTATRKLTPEHDQIIRVLIRQRLQKHAVDDTEDRRVDTDSQGQSEHDHAGEGRACPDAAMGR